MRVVDVLDKYKFSLALIEEERSNQQLYNNIREKDIETVIPKGKDEEVVIVRGENKGEIGKVLSRDKKSEEIIV